MYSCKRMRIEVDVELDCGLYAFDVISATGKTRLYNVIKILRELGEPVFGYSYSDWKLGLSTEGMKNVKLVVIDRYDLFYCKLNKEIKEAVENGAIVLMDCKHDIYLNAELCEIEMSMERIRVT